jgi:ribonuclease HII
MMRALEALETAAGPADHVLIDGVSLGIHVNEQAIVRGDGKVASIAAASIIAKAYRDALMIRYSEEYPAYEWHSNKGYGSLAHREAIKRYGLSPLHRQSFCQGIMQEGLQESLQKSLF